MWGWVGGWGIFSPTMVICSVDIGGISNHRSNFWRGSDPDLQSGLLKSFFPLKTAQIFYPEKSKHVSPLPNTALSGPISPKGTAAPDQLLPPEHRPWPSDAGFSSNVPNPRGRWQGSLVAQLPRLLPHLC